MEGARWSRSGKRARTREATAAVRVGELRRALERLIALPAPLAVSVVVDRDRVVWTEHDDVEEWWSSISVPAKVPGSPSLGEPRVTVPRMVVREVVGLESLARADGAECIVSVVDGTELRIDTFSVPASRSAPPIDPPPRFEEAEPLVDQVILPDEEFRHSNPGRVVVGAPGHRRALRFSGAALDRFVARGIRSARLVGAGDHQYLVGATPAAVPERLVLVARGRSEPGATSTPRVGTFES